LEKKKASFFRALLHRNKISSEVRLTAGRGLPPPDLAGVSSGVPDPSAEGGGRPPLPSRPSLPLRPPPELVSPAADLLPPLAAPQPGEGTALGRASPGAQRPRDLLRRGVRPLQPQRPRDRLRRGRHTAPRVGLRPHSATIFSLLPTPTARPSRSLSVCLILLQPQTGLRSKNVITHPIRLWLYAATLLCLVFSHHLKHARNPHSPTTGPAVAAVLLRHPLPSPATSTIPSPWSSLPAVRNRAPKP